MKERKKDLSHNFEVTRPAKLKILQNEGIAF